VLLTPDGLSWKLDGRLDGTQGQRRRREKTRRENLGVLTEHQHVDSGDASVTIGTMLFIPHANILEGVVHPASSHTDQRSAGSVVFPCAGPRANTQDAKELETSAPSDRPMVECLF
jgi:hypothetical protein